MGSLISKWRRQYRTVQQEGIRKEIRNGLSKRSSETITLGYRYFADFLIEYPDLVASQVILLVEIRSALIFKVSYSPLGSGDNRRCKCNVEQSSPFFSFEFL